MGLDGQARGALGEDGEITEAQRESYSYDNAQWSDVTGEDWSNN